MSDNLFCELNALDAQQSELNAKYAELRSEALSFAKTLTQRFDFTAEELGLYPDTCKVQKVSEEKGRKTRKPVEPKYQNPAGEETWSGRGVRPLWFRQAVEAGITKEEMLIKKA